jgi:hypothetical protein
MMLSLGPQNKDRPKALRHFRWVLSVAQVTLETYLWETDAQLSIGFLGQCELLWSHFPSLSLLSQNSPEPLSPLNQDKSELGAVSPGLVHGSRSRCPAVTMLMMRPKPAGVSSEVRLKPYSSMGFLRQSPLEPGQVRARRRCSRSCPWLQEQMPDGHHADWRLRSHSASASFSNASFCGHTFQV